MTRLYTNESNVYLTEPPCSRKLLSANCMYSNYTELVNSKDTQSQTVATGSSLSCWQMYLK